MVYIKDKLEDILFSIIQNLPERFLSPSLMDWLDKYITKRTTELHHQITKSKWQQSELEATLSKIKKSEDKK